MGKLPATVMFSLAALITALPSATTVAGQEVKDPKTDEGGSHVPGPVRDLWGATRDFGYETWLVASSPARLDRPSAVKLGGVVLTGGVLFALDEQIRDRLQTEGSPGGLHRFLRDVGDFVEPVGLQGNTNVYWAGTAILGYLTRQEWLQDPAKQVLYSQWIGGMGRQLVGYLVGRKRPGDEEGAYAFERGEGTSFPSGHSAVAFELAYVLSHHIGRWPATVLLYGLAGSMAFQRVDSDSHWSSDAWLGSAWGLLVAKTVVAAEESDRFLVEPVLDFQNGRSGMGLRVRF